LEKDERVAALFFELASESRLSILRELEEDNLRMQEIARRLDVTATEAFRQLQRLTEVGLVRREPDGAFDITEYGRLVLHLSGSHFFVSRYRDYFQYHNIWGIPVEFVNRIGELSGTELVLDTIECVNRSISIFLEAEEFAWGISERGSEPDHLDPLMDEKIQQGIEFRLMIPEKFLPTIPTVNGNVEVRGLEEVNAVVAVSEREAAFFLPFTGGRIDYSGFFGSDPVFLKWARDFFQYCWDGGKRF
jgi:predicted transcriptional regulator